MNKAPLTFQSLSIKLLVTTFILNSCAFPQTTSSDQVKGDFKLQQTSNLQGNQDLFQSLPQKNDPADQLELLSIDENLPITFKIIHKFPKNLETGLDGINLVPAVLSPLKIPAKNSKVIRKDTKAEVQSWRRWLKGYFRDVYSSLSLIKMKELEKNQKDLVAALASEPDAKKQNQLRKLYESRKQEIAKQFKLKLQELRNAFQSDRNQIISRLEAYYGNTNGFNTKALPNLLALDSLVQVITSSLSTVISSLAQVWASPKRH